MSGTALDVLGYINYRKRLTKDGYNESTLSKIIDHRDAILSKYSDCDDRSVYRTAGMCYTKNMFFPIDYDGVVVDCNSVFAAAYNICYSKGVWKKRNEKHAFWVLFTNDPYIPVMPMVYIQSYSTFERIFGKEKNELKPVIERLCRNLKYPICTTEHLKEMIEHQYSVNGSLKKEFVSEQLYNVDKELGFFDINTISCEPGEKTLKILKEHGYVND